MSNSNIKSGDLRALLKSTKAGRDAEKKGADALITDYRKEPQEGVDEVKRMIAADPGNLDLQDWLAFMHYSNGSWDEALMIYKSLLAAGFRPANQHLYIGNCYYKKGLKSLAVESWRKSASLDPDGTIGKKANDRLQSAISEGGE